MAEEQEEVTGNDELLILHYKLGPPANILVSLSIDKRLIELWQPLDFERFENIDKGLWVIKDKSEDPWEEHDCQSTLGLQYRFVADGPRHRVADLSALAKKADSILGFELSKICTADTQNPTAKANWLAFDHFLLFEVTVAPFDRLPSNHQDNKINCSNSRLVEKNALSNANHVVYIARDSNGQVKYIGEGKSSRPEHVNSGTSHVYNLNKEHFAGKSMAVEIYSEGLTKSESLTIERLLLARYAGCDLWNIKDFKP